MATVTNNNNSKSKPKRNLLGSVEERMGFGTPGVTTFVPKLPMRPQGPLGLRNLAPIAIQRAAEADAGGMAASPALNAVARQSGRKKQELVRRPGNMSGGLSQGSYGNTQSR
jgi:hypothetical protein